MKWEGYCSPFISLYTPTNLTFLYLYIYCCDLFLVHFIIIHLLFFFFVFSNNNRVHIFLFYLITMGVPITWKQKNNSQNC